jgi:seryl-tRNA synthetase
MPGDDRDVRKKITPPAGVRAQTAGEFSDPDETPVEGDPVAQINTRARNAAHNSKQAVTKLVVLDAKVDGYQRQVDTYFEIDQAEHKRIYAQLDSQSEKLDGVRSDIGDLKGDVGEVKGALETLNKTITMQLEVHATQKIEDAKIESARRIESAKIESAKQIEGAKIESAKEIATVEVEQRRELATIEDKVETAKFERKARYKKLTIIGSIITLLGTLLYALLR